MKLQAETLKTAGAALTIAAAALIMAPGLFNLAAGLTRMLIIIGIGFAVSLGAALIWYNLKKAGSIAAPPVSPTQAVPQPPGSESHPS